MNIYEKDYIELKKCSNWVSLILLLIIVVLGGKDAA